LQNIAYHFVDTGASERSIDSRSGDGIFHPITQTTARLLEFLETPRRCEQVAAEFGQEDSNRALAMLRDKRLLFEEGERLMSLVVI
jgi:hypothetical protein